jgi:transcriptional regulator with PAS, ATPase and Fis domain
MKIVCSYCRKKTGEKEPLDDDRVSHTICHDCYKHYSKQIKGLSLGDYLDQFDAPILFVDADGRVLASNKMAESALGKSRQDFHGLLGGEAMECVYARLPEGCGKTVHCETCTIRRVVMKAMNNGKPQLDKTVTLVQAAKEIKMKISTEKFGDLVRIVIHDIASD